MADKRGKIPILFYFTVLAYMASMVSALVVGFIYSSCHTEMYTWLHVYGWTMAIHIIIHLVLPPIEAIEEEGKTKALIILLQSSIIFMNIFQLFIVIFVFGWIIYGAVLFFPAASCPYPSCTDGQDGKVPILTGTVLVVLYFVICLCRGVFMFLIARKKEESGQIEEATLEMGAYKRWQQSRQKM